MHDYLRSLKNLRNVDELDLFEEEIDSDYRPASNGRRKPRGARNDLTLIVEEPETTHNEDEGFNPTFHSSRHEREWILTYLGGFYNDHVITDVVRQVKGGKEATVYCCEAHPSTGTDLIAAKVYRPRMFRNLKNDSMYREGKQMLNTEGKWTRNHRELRAMEKKTRFGQSLMHLNWLMNEHGTMRALYNAGADVPKPFASSENAILMEYMGEVGWPAPTLSQVSLAKEEARPLFDRAIHNIDLMLAHNCIHGDLSAHNILYWDGQIKLIDFPQAVDPYVNPHAYPIFARDVLRVCQYFAKHGVEVDPEELALTIWKKYFPL